MKPIVIIIIYNPKSSGESAREAQRLYSDIRKQLPNAGVEVVPTKYAGHATEVTEITGRTRRNVIVLSIGGDGTYNEVVNGALKVPLRERPVCIAVPAGNANDHATELAPQRPVIDRLEHGIPASLDVLKVSVHNPVGDDILRYAHSYVGFGSSGRVAHWLNNHSAGPVSEKLAVMRELLRPQRFEIIINGRMNDLYSLVLGNVGRMAKHLTLSDSASIVDGKFEVVATPALSRMQLVKEVAGSVAGKPQKPTKSARYSFILMTPVQAQFDGEPVWLPKGATVTVTAQAKALKTFI